MKPVGGTGIRGNLHGIKVNRRTGFHCQKMAKIQHKKINVVNMVQMVFSFKRVERVGVKEEEKDEAVPNNFSCGSISVADE